MDKNYRVRMIVYEDDPEVPTAQSDEPLYNNVAEIALQAYRLQTSHAKFVESEKALEEQSD